MYMKHLAISHIATCDMYRLHAQTIHIACCKLYASQGWMLKSLILCMVGLIKRKRGLISVNSLFAVAET